MVDGWIGVMWATFVAAVLGLLVAAGANGQTPSIVVLGALVVAPVLITVVHRRRRSRRWHRALEQRQETLTPPKPLGMVEGERSRPSSPQPSGRVEALDDADWSAVSEICSALDGRQLDWLRRNDFVTPWLDGRMRPVLDLEPHVGEAAKQPFGSEIGATLDVLHRALVLLVTFYGENTFPDPLLLGEDWRFFERDDAAGGAERGTRGDPWGGRALQLHELAVQAADAYEEVVSVATQDSRIRKRVSLQV